MTYEKFIAPLTTLAAVLGVWAYLRSGNSNAPVQGNLPIPAPLPSFQNIPYSEGNPATPSSNAGQNSLLPSVSADGLNAPVFPTTSNTGATSTTGACCGCGPNASDSWNSGVTWADTIQQNSML